MGSILLMACRALLKLKRYGSAGVSPNAAYFLFLRPGGPTDSSQGRALQTPGILDAQWSPGGGERMFSFAPAGALILRLLPGIRFAHPWLLSVAALRLQKICGIGHFAGSKLLLLNIFAQSIGVATAEKGYLPAIPYSLPARRRSSQDGPWRLTSFWLRMPK
jgi:hypothetical protein